MLRNKLKARKKKFKKLFLNRAHPLFFCFHQMTRFPGLTEMFSGCFTLRRADTGHLYWCLKVQNNTKVV